MSSRVRWYFVPDTHPFPPFPHRFSSENWDQTHWWNGGAGEPDGEKQPYDKGAPPKPFEPDPFHTKDHAPCGPPEWWADGAPSDAPPEKWLNGLPECCPAAFRMFACSCSSANFNALPPVGPCGFCPLNPAQWKLTVSDIVDAGCTACASLNASGITLDHIPFGLPDHAGELSNGCYWQSPLVGPGCTSGPFSGVPWFFELRYNFNSAEWELYLRAGLAQVAFWTVVVPASFACFGPQTFLGPPRWSAGTCFSTASVTITHG